MSTPLSSSESSDSGPRCYVIEPRYDRAQATARAGARSDDVFGLPGIRMFQKRQTKVQLVQRRLVPFWSVGCKSSVHYDRVGRYEITPPDEDIIEITLVGQDGNKLLFPINRQSKDRIVTLNAIERCKTEKDLVLLTDAYDTPIPTSTMTKIIDSFKQNDTRMVDYLSNPMRIVGDFGQLYQEKKIDGRSIFLDLTDGEEVEVILPNKEAVRVISDVVQQAQIPIKQPRNMYESILEINAFELYYRPMYIFRFDELDRAGPVGKPKIEQFDGLSGLWTALPTQQVQQPDIQWDKVLWFSLEAVTELVATIGPPGLQIPAIIFKTSMKYLKQDSN